MRFLAPLFPCLVLLAATPALAGHANPWATDDDDLLMQYHDDNLQQSEDTPGDDEMLGIMEQQAVGKLETRDPGQGMAAADTGGGHASGSGGSAGGGSGGNGGQR